jgi:exosortase
MITSAKARLAAGVVALGFVVLYWQVFSRLVFDWYHDDNYSHGFLIIPIAAYFAWERRERLKTAAVNSSVFGLVVVVGSIVMLLAGILGSELFLTRVSIVGALAGSVLFMFGWRHLRILAFPIAFLLLMIPIPAIIFNQIAFPLQLLASRFGEAAMGMADVPVLREGNVLILANTTLEVAEACSGIRSLVSLLTLAIVLGYFSDRRLWVRTAVALSSIPVAVITNGFRVAGTGIAAHRFGPAAAEGFFHEFSGWLVFVAAFALTLAIQRLIAIVAPQAPLPTAVAASV